MNKPVTQEDILSAFDIATAHIPTSHFKSLRNRIQAHGIAPPDGSKFMGLDVAVSPFLPPEGWVLVPVEPTTEMKKKAWSLVDASTDYKTQNIVTTLIYKAMLAAAPKPENKT